MSKGLLGGALLLAMVAAGCSPIITTHGYAPTAEQVAEIQPGVDSVQTVSQKIGRPSTGGIVRSRSWYYVGSRLETVTWHAPKLIERRVVAVDFTPEGVVERVDQYGLEDGRIINLVTRTTPTYGRRLGVLEQLFGNLGNIGAQLPQQ
jgi:outer membrane protein assembly factor BamE (lipoprotein component of BamABCDE complex)